MHELFIIIFSLLNRELRLTRHGNLNSGLPGSKAYALNDSITLSQRLWLTFLEVLKLNKNKALEANRLKNSHYT